MKRIKQWLLTMGACSLLLLVGCGSDGAAEGLFNDAPPPPPPNRGAAALQSKDGGADAAQAPVVTFREEDFAETDRSRDPFRSFSKQFIEESKNVNKSQREVVLEQYSLGDLKLVGIVSGGAEARAMLVDPHGVGWIVRRGQYIGKTEVVQAGPGGLSYEVNWRIDRIRDGDLVFIREDPAHADVPPATRIVPLRPEDASEAKK